ncbi:MAG: hypothetical protein ACYC5G_04010 [Candidatus Doudnabacteria bacterium]
MLVSELVSKLLTYPQDLEVRTLNTAIEDDCSCPTFTIHSVSSNSENNEEFDSVRDVEYLVIEFTDDEYIQDEFNINN